MDAKAFADEQMMPDSKLRSTVKRGVDAGKTVTVSAENDPYEKAMARLDEINSKYYGIDGDQGYKYALWGFSRPEIALLLSKEKEFSTLKRLVNADVFTLDGKDRLELHYLNNVLFKTVLRKGDCNGEIFQQFCEELREKYGSAKNGKDEDIDIYEDVVSGDLKADSKNSVGNVYAISWKGENTTGTLSFVYDYNNRQFKDVIFTKEYKNQKK